MKLVVTLLAAVFAAIIFQGAARAGGGSTELYSWKDKEGAWLYVLAPGTNFQKNEKEIKSRKPIKGAEELKKQLALSAVGEIVTWSDHRLTGFEFPSEETRKEIAKAAEEAKIELEVDLDSPIEPTLIRHKVNLVLGEEFRFKWKRAGDQLRKPTKLKGDAAKNGSVYVKLGETAESPFPPPREGATRPYLHIENNFEETLSFRVLVRMQDPNNRHHAAFERLSGEVISLPAGEGMNKCWAFDALVAEVVLYDFKLSDPPAK